MCIKGRLVNQDILDPVNHCVLSALHDIRSARPWSLASRIGTSGTRWPPFKGQAFSRTGPGHIIEAGTTSIRGMLGANPSVCEGKCEEDERHKDRWNEPFLHGDKFPLIQLCATAGSLYGVSRSRTLLIANGLVRQCPVQSSTGPMLISTTRTPQA